MAFDIETAHEDPYPSHIAMEAAVQLEIHAALGRVQTQTIGKVIQRAINLAIAEQVSKLASDEKRDVT